MENALDDRKEVNELFKNILASLPEFEELLAKCSGHWGYEDSVYRFYHQSFKVYSLQDLTLEIVERLQGLAPGCPLNNWFMQIVREGTGLRSQDQSLRHSSMHAISWRWRSNTERNLNPRRS